MTAAKCQNEIRYIKKRAGQSTNSRFSYWVRESNPYCKIENLEY